MLPKEAWKDLATSLPLPKKLVRVAFRRCDESVWVVEDKLS